jgi:hypothetical protein
MYGITFLLSRISRSYFVHLDTSLMLSGLLIICVCMYVYIYIYIVFLSLSPCLCLAFCLLSKTLIN